MKSDYFFSESTGLYVSRKPLVIDARIKEAAKKANITIDWNDEGRIIYSDLDDSNRLLNAAGAIMMTPDQFWAVYKDTIKTGDIDMQNELMSCEYTEWLNRVYLTHDTFINSPKILGNHKYEGEIKKSKAPNLTPGYFDPENNINEFGEPINVVKTREKFAVSWKYWAPNVEGLPCGAGAPIRGYVTSVGKPSYDLGIPTDNRQPNLMIRECRYSPLSSAIDPEILEKAEHISDIVEFVKTYGELFATSKDSLVYKLRESFIDRLGDEASIKDIRDAAQTLCPLADKKIKYSHFADFVRQSTQTLENAIQDSRDVIFVMGHKNPDTDTVISSLFEAYRNSLVDSTAAYIPIVQSKKMPDEIAHLLGDLSISVLMTDNSLYEKARKSGTARWISVDQNQEKEVQKYFISIVDHHFISESARNRDFTKTLEMLGSTAALITRKFIGMGIELDEKTSSLLYGAALMDTENRVKHKMTPKDYKIMNYLKLKSNISQDNEFYGSLMSKLLNTDDAEILFGRDYKEDWGFGFAVAKTKNFFSKTGELLKTKLNSDLYTLASENNKSKNLPMTLLKITDYKEDNETVNLERIYLVFNKVSNKFEENIRKTMESIIHFEFPQENVAIDGNTIDFYGSGLQLSRKKTAPVIEPIVVAFNRYFYSPSLKKYVKRDFQKKTSLIKGNYSTDKDGRINYITKKEADEIALNAGFSMLSLPEFWQVRKDAINANDIQMLNSLEGSNFVEMLDTEIVERKIMINHGREKIDIKIPKGNPGLIHPDEIDLQTGLPTKVHPPNIYGNKELWRYWEPDCDHVIPCRSYIFILKQPCLDGKFHEGESFPNLGIRPVRDSIVEPEIEINWNDSELNVKIIEHEETNEFRWPKLIWEK